MEAAQRRAELGGIGSFELTLGRARISLPVILFAAGALASGVLLLVWQSHLTFFYDDWDPLLDRRGWSAHAILDPHVDHINIANTLIYKAIQETIGMESLLPYAVVSTATFLAGVALLFVYIRRRVGDWLALAGTLPILFLGAAHDDLLWPYQIFFFGSMAFGLGALLALERKSARGDAIACLLLVLGLTFSELALAFAVGAAVAIALDRGPWRRLYVVAVPVFLYAVWYLGWGHTAESHITAHGIAVSFLYVLNGLAASIASILGLTDIAGTGGLGWGRPLLLVLLVALVLRLRARAPVSPWLWVVIAIALTFWFLTAVNAANGRPPTASRYQFVGAVLTILVVAELAAGVRLDWRGVAATLGVAVAAVLGNLSLLHEWYEDLSGVTPTVRGGLSGLEIAADTVSPDLVLDQQNSDFNYLNAVAAGSYLSAESEFGSPAYTPAELSDAPERARVAADKVLGTGTGIVYRSLDRAPSASGPPPTLVGPPGAATRSGPSCLTIRGTGGQPAVVGLPPGGAILEATPGVSAGLMLRRFAEDSFPIDGGTLRGVARLEIPLDRSDRPWQLEVAPSGPITVCGDASG